MSERPTPLALERTWQVCLLGAPCIVTPDGAAHPLERKDAALLALLAAKGSMSRAQAAALLWPDANDTQARRNLRQRLFRLRRYVRCTKPSRAPSSGAAQSRCAWPATGTRHSDGRRRPRPTLPLPASR